MTTQKATGSKRCAVKSPVSVWARDENGEMIGDENGRPFKVELEIDLNDESTYGVCGATAQRHGGTKRPITDHPYGGESGTEIFTKFPKCSGGCGRTLEKGEQYRKWVVNFGPTFIRCMSCAAPSRSSMTSSEILSMAWDIADQSIEDSEVATLEDAESKRDELAEAIQEVVDLIQEKLDNIESGMGHTYAPVYEELDERRSEYESWQQEMESVDFSDLTTDEEDEDGEDEEGFDADGARERLEEALSAAPE
jgi:hypothetical protein